MKTTLITLLILISCTSFAQQSKSLIKFRATEEASPMLGVKWDFNYIEKKFPLDIDFDGKVLNMIYVGGEVLERIDVISFERIVEKDKAGTSIETFTLKVNRKPFIAYIIIEKKVSSTNLIKTIKIPYIDKHGQVWSYWYYQEFK